MTYIQPHMIRQADVLRLVVTRDGNGNVSDESYTTVYGTHNVDLQPLTTRDLVANDQLKFKVSHYIFPETVAPFSFVSLGDRYRIGQKLYRIVKRHNHIDACYFEVYDDAPEQGASAATVIQNAYVVENLGPGNYTYGSGALAAVPAFSAKPILLDTLMNDGGYWIANATASGFTIVDRGFGESPLVSVYIKGTPA